mgnify:CR=1 FL=1
MRTRAEIETRLANLEKLAREMEDDAIAGTVPAGNPADAWRRGRMDAAVAMRSQANGLRWVLTDSDETIAQGRQS